MTRFRLSRQAESDLKEIADYVADRNPSAAVNELEKLFNKFGLLGRNPLLGELRQDLPGKPRSFTAGNFVVLYKPTADGIEVARVVHAARDFGAIFRHKET
ncbi:MAG: type II toxin-antitoxin system RelE/ParE family toxin [Planctomycetes bacterium]|nr:type II toxin-antitoxin system RelE/ParE family toxin [Planctomycetota bacterium]MBU4400563.1 type II toxin-antitoxin system RelE/ParE family toxin [Planctomycetota bacterium]MCG2682923.1 type II toxin-antitoxin system RelE/ParE family toxin [Planctomycetales bacterium]